MSKGVSKHCSILNYLRRNDEELHDLLQDLCIGKMLLPRKGTPGITFLRPDKALLKDIQKMASGDEPENAIEVLQSLVLLDNLETIAEFDQKKSDIPTYLRKKLPVASADGKKVVLTNGAEITPDSDFAARKDRGNISVYIISKALVPTDGPDADFSNAKVQAKKGGADLDGTRRELFERVVDVFCNSDRDPAMELLVAMHGWASSVADSNPDAKQLKTAIENKASFDTLATLAVIMQPYNAAGSPHLTDAALGAFRTVMYGTSAESSQKFKDYAAFSRNPEVVSKYAELASGPATPSTEAVAVRAASQKISAKMGKLNAVSLLNKFYSEDCADCIPKDCPKLSALQLFAEAELRVLSATVLENSGGRFDCDELKALYSGCKLDKPYMCADKDLMQSANLGFYYSTVYLIARSDALCYVPCMKGDDTSKVAVDGAFISLNATMEDVLRSKREASGKAIVGLNDLKF